MESWRTHRFSPWNYFAGGSGNSVAPELASGSGSVLYLVVVDARLSGNKRGKSVVTVPFLTTSLLGLLFSNIDCQAGVLVSNPGGSKDFPLGITSIKTLKGWFKAETQAQWTSGQDFRNPVGMVNYWSLLSAATVCLFTFPHPLHLPLVQANANKLLSPLCRHANVDILGEFNSSLIDNSLTSLNNEYIT